MPELHTARLVLRPLGPADLDAVHRYASDRALTRYMLFLPNETREETAAFLRDAAAQWEKEKPSAYEFGVLLGDELIGAVSVYCDDELGENAGELGWVFRSEYQKRGYALEAARAVAGFARETLGLTRLVAHCDARNRPSARLMERLGMTLEDAEGERTYPKTGETARELRYAVTFPGEGARRCSSSF